ncbi:hypothetical protein IFM89_037455 [Coptis chinensis]|uniref:Uncharacterized protein n=1 Tax=Coptis chinensis TaxID=261450 RepID=A0A835HSM4_9MAGN|nr:hypothetical protein IFM89_037455 [Coptis chinensis]
MSFPYPTCLMLMLDLLVVGEGVLAIEFDQSRRSIVLCEDEKQAVVVKSQLQQLARPMYKTPFVHGALIVSTILSSPGLKEPVAAGSQVNCNKIAGPMSDNRLVHGALIVSTILSSPDLKSTWFEGTQAKSPPLLFGSSDQPYAENETNDSPIEQVRNTIPIMDDPLPVLTFRTWIFGITTCAFLAFTNEFFFFQQIWLTSTLSNARHSRRLMQSLRVAKQGTSTKSIPLRILLTKNEEDRHLPHGGSADSAVAENEVVQEEDSAVNSKTDLADNAPKIPDDQFSDIELMELLLPD